MERKGNCKYIACVSGYERCSPGDRCHRRNAEKRRQLSWENGGAGWFCVSLHTVPARLECLLKERPGRNVWQHDRRLYGRYAIWRKISAYAGADDDCQTSRAGWQVRYRHDDELRHGSLFDELEPISRGTICGTDFCGKNCRSWRRFYENPIYIPRILQAHDGRWKEMGRADGSLARRLRCPDEAGTSLHRR